MCPRGCRASLGASSATLYVWGDGTLIRIEEEKDWSSVHGLHASVFERPAEADRADALREQAIPVVSLVAEDRGTVAGYIMFSPVSLTGHSGLKIMGLAPMAVAHGQQRKGLVPRSCVPASSGADSWGSVRPSPQGTSGITLALVSGL